MLLIRKAQQFDCRSYFQLVNDQLVRQNSINTDMVQWDEHKKWFMERLSSKNTLLLVAEKENFFLGQVRFDYCSIRAVWFIDYSINKDFRGRGYAKEMVKKSMIFLSKLDTKSYLINASVKHENHPSKKVFQALGFNILDQDELMVTYTKKID